MRFVIRPKLSKWEKKVAEANNILMQDATKIAKKGGLNGVKPASQYVNYKSWIKTDPQRFFAYSQMLPTTAALAMQKIKNERLEAAGIGSVLQASPATATMDTSSG